MLRMRLFLKCCAIETAKEYKFSSPFSCFISFFALIKKIIPAYQAQFLSVEELTKATSAAAATSPDDSLTTRLVRSGF